VKLRHILSALACCLLAPSSIGVGFANQLPRFSLEEKVAQSDVVLIGRVVAMRPENRVETYATVKVVEVLKGTVKGNVRFLAKGGISEMEPDCCDVGANYLFFLKKDGSGIYFAVNGRYGVYKLPKE